MNVTYTKWCQFQIILQKKKIYDIFLRRSTYRCQKTVFIFLSLLKRQTRFCRILLVNELNRQNKRIPISGHGQLTILYQLWTRRCVKHSWSTVNVESRWIFMDTALDFSRKYFLLSHGKAKPSLEFRVSNGDILYTGLSVIVDLKLNSQCMSL